MGLYVNSVSEIPLSETRSYYLYLLDYYNWDEPITNTLRNNSQRIASFCASNDAVMITGLPNSHFYSEVLSWEGINGQGVNTILPALLITTIPPKYFIDADNMHLQTNKNYSLNEISESLIFLKIRDICKQPDEVINLIEKILKDIKDRKKIQDFTITRELRKGEHGAFVDALILEPNISGLGINVKKLASWIKGRVSHSLRKNN